MPVEDTYSSAFLATKRGSREYGSPVTGSRTKQLTFKRLVLAERVDDARVRVGHEEHVRLLDLLEAADRRAVEAVALLEAVLGELVRRRREVLHQPRQIAEAEVDDLDALVLHESQHLGRTALLHGVPPSSRFGCRREASRTRLRPPREPRRAQDAVQIGFSTVAVLHHRLRFEGAAAGLDDGLGHLVRIAVGVGPAVLDVALLVHLDLPGDPDRGTAVRHAVGELVPGAVSCRPVRRPSMP